MVNCCFADIQLSLPHLRLVISYLISWCCWINSTQLGCRVTLWQKRTVLFCLLFLKKDTFLSEQKTCSTKYTAEAWIVTARSLAELQGLATRTVAESLLVWPAGGRSIQCVWCAVTACSTFVYMYNMNRQAVFSHIETTTYFFVCVSQEPRLLRTRDIKTLHSWFMYLHWGTPACCENWPLSMFWIHFTMV